jgi:hypothetical protein
MDVPTLFACSISVQEREIFPWLWSVGDVAAACVLASLFWMTTPV